MANTTKYILYIVISINSRVDIVYLSVCLSVYLFICMSVYLSICKSVCLYENLDLRDFKSLTKFSINIFHYYAQNQLILDFSHALFRLCKSLKTEFNALFEC